MIKSPGISFGGGIISIYNVINVFITSLSNNRKVKLKVTINLRTFKL